MLDELLVEGQHVRDARGQLGVVKAIHDVKADVEWKDGFLGEIALDGRWSDWAPLEVPDPIGPHQPLLLVSNDSEESEQFDAVLGDLEATGVVRATSVRSRKDAVAEVGETGAAFVFLPPRRRFRPSAGLPEIEVIRGRVPARASHAALLIAAAFVKKQERRNAPAQKRALSVTVSHTDHEIGPMLNLDLATEKATAIANAQWDLRKSMAEISSRADLAAFESAVRELREEVVDLMMRAYEPRICRAIPRDFQDLSDTLRIVSEMKADLGEEAAGNPPSQLAVRPEDWLSVAEADSLRNRVAVVFDLLHDDPDRVFDPDAKLAASGARTVGEIAAALVSETGERVIRKWHIVFESRDGGRSWSDFESEELSVVEQLPDGGSGERARLSPNARVRYRGGDATKYYILFDEPTS